MIIEVKNLSKKYHIARQRGGGYVALRDVLTNVMKSPFRFIKKRAERVLDREDKEEFWALKDINFNVEQGEVLGIIGANGAGKSTLLKILSRITPPTEGEVRMRGRVSSLLEVGTGFHPELTGRENIFLNGAILGMTRKEISRKFDEIVDFSGIEKFLDTPIKRYSSGMQVRLAFSVAAHLEPEILLVDEVLAVGDAEFQKKSLGKMEDVTKKEGRTILFVSHNMGAVQTLCNKTILLKDGKIKIIGNTESVVAEYLKSALNKKSEVFFKEDQSGKDANFVKLFIQDNAGEQKINFKMSESVHICMEFKVNADNIRLNPGIHIYNQYGQCLFVSSNVHELKFRNNDFCKGKYKFECVIPGNFFNEGIYHISYILSVGSLTNNVDRYEQILAFEILDDFVLRGDYTGGWLGLVKPKLNWILSKLD